MLNDDVVDLYGRVKIGTKVVVLPDGGRRLRDVASKPEPRPARQAAAPAPQAAAPRVTQPVPTQVAAPVEAAQQGSGADRVSATRQTAGATIYF
jgi:hypothetical protein